MLNCSAKAYSTAKAAANTGVKRAANMSEDPPHIVDDMAGEEAEPDGEEQQRAGRATRAAKRLVEGLPPHVPGERQHAEADGDELLLQFEGAVHGPEPRSFEIGAHGEAIGRVD